MWTQTAQIIPLMTPFNKPNGPNRCSPRADIRFLFPESAEIFCDPPYSYRALRWQPSQLRPHNGIYNPY